MQTKSIMFSAWQSFRLVYFAFVQIVQVDKEEEEEEKAESLIAIIVFGSIQWVNGGYTL